MKKIIKAIIPYRQRIALYKLINLPAYLKAKYFDNRELHFDYNKEELNYFIHLHNRTFANERAIEIPIILRYLELFKNKNILEIGNVIRYYKKISHDVLDKYEKGRNIINKDICNYKTQKKYDLIISISTFEHIGFDESKRYGSKREVASQKREALLEAIKNTKTLLRSGGTFIFTVPLGFNSFLDSQLDENKLGLTEAYFYKRISLKNKWIQVQQDDIKGVQYDHPYPCANGLLVGIYQNN